MKDSAKGGVPPEVPGEVTPEGVEEPTGDGAGNKYVGDRQPPEQPSGCVGAPGAAGGDEVEVDERGRK